VCDSYDYQYCPRDCGGGFGGAAGAAGAAGAGAR